MDRWIWLWTLRQTMWGCLPGEVYFVSLFGLGCQKVSRHLHCTLHHIQQSTQPVQREYKWKRAVSTGEVFRFIIVMREWWSSIFEIVLGGKKTDMNLTWNLHIEIKNINSFSMIQFLFVRFIIVSIQKIILKVHISFSLIKFYLFFAQ